MNEVLGKTGKDKVTGFEGTIIGIVSYLTGCNQLLVQPVIRDGGDFKEARWIDDSRVTIGKEIISPSDVTGDKNGADVPAPVK